MKIKWFGHACFLLNSGGVKILTDPFDRSVGYEIPDVTVDLITESHQHFDHNAHNLIRGRFELIKDAGHEEFKGIKIDGIKAFHDEHSGRDRGSIIIFKFEFSEGLNVVHCGDLGHLLDESQKKALGQVDILLIPVGGKFTIDAEKAKKVVDSLKPKVVIPMHYKTKYLAFDLAPVNDFLKLFSSYENVGKEWEVNAKTIEAFDRTVKVFNV